MNLFARIISLPIVVAIHLTFLPVFADPLLTVTPSALAKYGLRAGVDGEGTNGVAYLLYTPKASGSKPLPMVVYLPGRGGRGNVGKLFANKTIFARVTSSAFQKEHPCYLLALAPARSLSNLDGASEDVAVAFLAAMCWLLACNKTPHVDWLTANCAPRLVWTALAVVFASATLSATPDMKQGECVHQGKMV